MAPTLDASSPVAVYNDTAANTSLVTASFTPPSGSIVVVKIVSGDAAQTHSTPTGTGLTFTSQANIGSASNCRVSIWTATGAGAATTVSANFAGTAEARHLRVEVWTSTQLAATPAVHTLGTGSGAPSDSITTVAANSVVTWASGDWLAVDGTTRTFRSSAVETAYHTNASQCTMYAAYQQAATAGAQTYGLTAPVGQKFAMAALEIQSSGAAVATPIRRVGKRR